jgi:hypothetical protein
MRARSASAVGSNHCYDVPIAFNDRMRSFMLYPEGSAVVGLRLFGDYYCNPAVSVNMTQFFSLTVESVFPLDELSSCTYRQFIPLALAQVVGVSVSVLIAVLCVCVCSPVHPRALIGHPSTKQIKQSHEQTEVKITLSLCCTCVV